MQQELTETTHLRMPKVCCVLACFQHFVQFIYIQLYYVVSVARPNRQDISWPSSPSQAEDGLFDYEVRCTVAAEPVKGLALPAPVSPVSSSIAPSPATQEVNGTESLREAGNSCCSIQEGDHWSLDRWHPVENIWDSLCMSYAIHPHWNFPYDLVGVDPLTNGFLPPFCSCKMTLYPTKSQAELWITKKIGNILHGHFMTWTLDSQAPFCKLDWSWTLESFGNQCSIQSSTEVCFRPCTPQVLFIL